MLNDPTRISWHFFPLDADSHGGNAPDSRDVSMRRKRDPLNICLSVLSFCAGAFLIQHFGQITFEKARLIDHAHVLMGVLLVFFPLYNRR